MQIFLGQPPPFFWWFIAPGALILLLAVAASLVLRSYARVAAVRGQIKVALARFKPTREAKGKKRVRSRE
jgi:hypothetical protein